MILCFRMTLFYLVQFYGQKWNYRAFFGNISLKSVINRAFKLQLHNQTIFNSMNTGSYPHTHTHRRATKSDTMHTHTNTWNLINEGKFSMRISFKIGSINFFQSGWSAPKKSVTFQDNHFCSNWLSRWILRFLRNYGKVIHIEGIMCIVPEKNALWCGIRVCWTICVWVCVVKFDCVALRFGILICVQKRYFETSRIHTWINRRKCCFAHI